MALSDDVRLIEILAEVDKEAKQYLGKLEKHIHPSLKKFALRKDVTLTQNISVLGKCSRCGSPASVILPGESWSEGGRIGEEPAEMFLSPGKLLCSECATWIADSEDAHIDFQIVKAVGKKANVVKRAKAASIPDAYSRLGRFAAQYGATEFKNNNNRMWYESEDGKRKFYLRFKKKEV